MAYDHVVVDSVVCLVNSENTERQNDDVCPSQRQRAKPPLCEIAHHGALMQAT